MRKIFAITAAAALCLCSCSDSNYTFVDSFPISGELQPVRTMKYDPVKVNLYGIARAGDYWLAYLADDDYDLAIVDDSLNVIVRTLRTGNGPAEFLRPVCYGSPYTKGDSVILSVKDMYRGTLNRVAVCLTDGKTDVRKTGEVPVMNRTYFETWGENIDAKEYEDWWIPRLQTSEIFTPDNSRMLVYTDRPYVWLHSTDGSLISKVYVEQRPDEVRNAGGLGFNCGDLLGNHFLLLFNDLVDEETWTCSTRLMIFDFDMRPEAVYSIAGDCYFFYADPETGLVYVVDPEEELIRVYDLSGWLRG